MCMFKRKPTKPRYVSRKEFDKAIHMMRSRQAATDEDLKSLRGEVTRLTAEVVDLDFRVGVLEMLIS